MLNNYDSLMFGHFVVWSEFIICFGELLNLLYYFFVITIESISIVEWVAKIL